MLRVSSPTAVEWVRFHCLIVLGPLTGPLFNGPHVEGGGAVNPVPCPSSAMAGCGVSFMGSEERTNVMKKWPRFTRPSLTAGKRRKLNQRALNRRPLLDRSDTSNNRHCVPSSQGTRRDCKKKKKPVVPRHTSGDVFMAARLHAPVALDWGQIRYLLNKITL